ncbi:MAG: sigma-70 family RNA polymerase sigma factor [Bacilli bacterium]|nr:sigma-70 family RNA polymerase sigma factor [Bacilli bacterium]
MYYLDMLLKKAESNNNRLSIEDIEKIKIQEKEYDELLKTLSDKGVIIEFRETLTDKEVDEIIKLTDFDKKYIQDEVKQYLNEIGKYPVLSKEEEFNLFKKYKIGDLEARDWIIKCNLKLVASYAKRYNNRINAFNTIFSYLDVVQEGNLGLVKAVEKFDETKGYKFSTYATWWIRQSIEREMSEKQRAIRIPIHRHEEIKKVKKYIETHIKEFGIEPTNEECANALHMDVKLLEELLMIKEPIVSLNVSIGEEDDSELMSFIPSNENIEEKITNKLVMKNIKQIMRDALTYREYTVLILRYGMLDGRERTLEEVGDIFKVTRERVRQIEIKAIRKLRSKLKNYTNDDIPFIR